MKDNKLSVKAIVSLAWLLVGVAAIFVGILLKVPDAETQFRSFIITSDSSVTQGMLHASSYTAMLVLKYILIASGVIVAAIASIGFAGALETAKLEELIFDEEDYYDEDECDFDCASCGAECESRSEEFEETAEEIAEEVAEEVVEEEITEEAAEETTEE